MNMCCFCKKAILADSDTDAKFSGERVRMEAAHLWQEVKTTKQLLHVFTSFVSWLEENGWHLLLFET